MQKPWHTSRHARRIALQLSQTEEAVVSYVQTTAQCLELSLLPLARM